MTSARLRTTFSQKTFEEVPTKVFELEGVKIGYLFNQLKSKNQAYYVCPAAHIVITIMIWYDVEYLLIDLGVIASEVGESSILVSNMGLIVWKWIFLVLLRLTVKFCACWCAPWSLDFLHMSWEVLGNVEKSWEIFFFLLGFTKPAWKNRFQPLIVTCSGNNVITPNTFKCI